MAGGKVRRLKKVVLKRGVIDQKRVIQSKNVVVTEKISLFCNLAARRASKEGMKTTNGAGKGSVGRMKRGDVDEFSRLVGTYTPRMLRLAAGIVRRRDVAEDVVQDALVKAYEHLGSWRGDGSLATWLYRITYTTALDALRRSDRKAFECMHDGSGGLSTASGSEDCMSGQISNTLINSHIDNDAGGESWSDTEENIVRMRRALDSLPPLDRTLIALFYLEERSVRDVAAICGQSEANVKTRLHRARRRLYELLTATQ